MPVTQCPKPGRSHTSRWESNMSIYRYSLLERLVSRKWMSLGAVTRTSSQIWTPASSLCTCRAELGILRKPISYTLSRSTVQVNTLTPVWNELWRVKNVPTTARLNVEVLDKDNGPTDDFIGRFHCDVSAGTKELEIESALLKRTKGMFWLKVRLRSFSRTLDSLTVP